MCGYPTHSELPPSQAKTSRIRLGKVLLLLIGHGSGPWYFFGLGRLVDNEPQCLAQCSVTSSLPISFLRHIAQAHLFEHTVTTDKSVAIVQIPFSRNRAMPGVPCSLACDACRRQRKKVHGDNHLLTLQSGMDFADACCSAIKLNPLVQDVSGSGSPVLVEVYGVLSSGHMRTMRTSRAA